MSAESWKLENDLCRCCHSEGTHKNLSEPCLEGEEEVYSAMLQDTLDINISPVSGPLGTITYTICEVCIMRLQDAWSFKQQVLQCETRFHDLYTRNVIKMEPDSVIINVKEEAVESDNEGFQEERLADDSEEDFPMSFDDGNKSDESEVEVQEETKKAKAKPKAKPKAKAPAKAPAKKKAAVRSVQAADAASSETQQSEPKEKKDEWVSPAGQAYYSGIQGTYRCNLCDKIRKRVWDIKKHIHIEHFSENGRPCLLCGIKFQKIVHVKRHLAKVHNVDEKGRELKETVCSTCQMKFKTLPELKKHKRACGKSTCSTCKMELKTLPELRKHKRACSKSIKKPKTIRLSRCPQCSREVRRHQIRRHLSEEHGLDVPTCGICGFTNKNNFNVILHQNQLHFKEKNVACPHCDMKFYDQNSLGKHIVRHNPVKKFECKFCKKRFPRKSTLQLHEKIHTGDKRIVCYVCGDRFVQKASLNYHMAKRHPDKEPHRSSYNLNEFIRSEEIDRVNRLVASKETFKKVDDMKDAAEERHELPV